MLKPITIKITGDDAGLVTFLDVEIRHKDGASRIRKCIQGQVLELIIIKINDLLAEQVEEIYDRRSQ